MDMFRIEPVTEQTFKQVVDMKLPPEQGCFVAPNVVSLAQAWLYHDESRPYAICDDDEVVGFMMLDWDEGERSVGIWRLMIATEHQNKGYGRKAVEAAITLARESDKIDMMYLDYVKSNHVARDMYHSFGFMENGKIEGDEIVMTMPLTDAPKVGILNADSDDFDDFATLIEKSKAAGVTIPKEFLNVQKLKKETENGGVKRLTLMGETIGLVMNCVVFLGIDSVTYLPEAIELISKQPYAKEVYEATLKRRSVRSFIDKEISDDVVEKLLVSAMAAPSACNKRPWEFYVIKNKELQMSLRGVSRYSDMNSSLIIIVAGNDKRSLNHRINDFWIQDCAAATENLLLTATELGIGSCWCGLYPTITPVNRVRKLLGLEEHIIPMALIHLGYPNEAIEPRTQYDVKRVHVFE